MYKIILTAAEETSAKSVFEGTNPQDLITEAWDIGDWSVSNGLLVKNLVDRLSKTLAYHMTLKSSCHVSPMAAASRNIQRTCRSMEHSVHGISTTQYNVISY